MSIESILESLNRNGYADSSVHPELTDAAVQRSLTERADQMGLTFSYDPVAKTAAIVRRSRHEYTLTQQATLLVAWMHLVYRQKVSRTIDQDGHWQTLTRESRLKAGLEELSLRPEYLSQRFPNLYPTPQHAQARLRDLDLKGFLSLRREESGDRYHATPLLSHVVDEDEAIQIIDGHLRDEFAGYLPEEGLSADLETSVLQLMQSLPRGGATIAVLGQRTEATRKDLDPILQRLKEEGIIRHCRGEARGGYWAMNDSSGGDEE